MIARNFINKMFVTDDSLFGDSFLHTWQLVLSDSVHSMMNPATILITCDEEPRIVAVEELPRTVGHWSEDRTRVTFSDGTVAVFGEGWEQGNSCADTNTWVVEKQGDHAPRYLEHRRDRDDDSWEIRYADGLLPLD